jgi:hypothetical protein
MSDTLVNAVNETEEVAYAPGGSKWVLGVLRLAQVREHERAVALVRANAAGLVRWPASWPRMGQMARRRAQTNLPAIFREEVGKVPSK